MHIKLKKRQLLRSKIVILSLASIFLCFSNSDDKRLKTVNIFKAPKTTLGITEIADEITYLHISNDIPIEYIEKVIYYDNNFYLQCDRSKLFRVDLSGHMFNQIGRKGNGPGEYHYVSDFAIHPKTGNIYISGSTEYQLLLFSGNGKFLKTIDLSHKHASSVGISGENLFLFYFDANEHVPENIELIDSTGRVFMSYPNKYKYERGRGSVSFIGECAQYTFDGKLHFKEIFSDTIFSIDGQNILPQIILDSGDKSFTSEVRTKIIEEVNLDPFNPSESMINHVVQNDLFETDNFLFYDYGYNRQERLLIYNKSTGKSIQIDAKEGITNDWDGGPNLLLKKNLDDNTVFSWIHAYELKEYVASDAFRNSTPKFPEKKKELEHFANSLDVNDNPVLMMVKLR